MNRQAFIWILGFIISAITLLAPKAQSQVYCQWLNAFGNLGVSDKPLDLVLDNRENIYVTGYSSDGSFNARSRFLTAKFDSTGNMLWSQSFGGGNSTHIGKALVVDIFGNTIVTGLGGSSPWSLETIKYDSEGEYAWSEVLPVNVGLNWHSNYNIAVDSSGNVYIGCTDFNTNSIHVVKYGPDGALIWDTVLNMSNGEEEPSRIILSNGFLYVTGLIWNGGQGDMILLKLNLSGDTIWTRSYNNPTGQDDYGLKVLADNNGDIVVGGVSMMSHGWTPALLKYNEAGDLIWESIFSEPGYRGGWLNNIDIDFSDNIYAECSINSNPPGEPEQDYLLVKYNSDGGIIWSRFVDDARGLTSVSSDLSVDRAGNAYVVRDLIVDSSLDIVTMKYNSDGELLWSINYDSPGFSEDRVGNIIVAENGDVYIAGCADVDSTNGNPPDTSGIDYDFVVAKYIQNAQGIENDNGLVPDQVSLLRNYPNPFNARTIISYNLSEAEQGRDFDFQYPGAENSGALERARAGGRSSGCVGCE